MSTLFALGLYMLVSYFYLFSMKNISDSRHPNFTWRGGTILREDLYDLIWDMGVINVARCISTPPMNLLEALEVHNIPRPTMEYWCSLGGERPKSKRLLPRRAPHGNVIEFVKGVESVVQTLRAKSRLIARSSDELRLRQNKRSRDKYAIENEKDYLDWIAERRRKDLEREKRDRKRPPPREFRPPTPEERQAARLAQEKRGEKFNRMITFAIELEHGFTRMAIAKKYKLSLTTVNNDIRKIERILQIKTQMPNHFIDQIFRPRSKGAFKKMKKCIVYNEDYFYDIGYSREGGSLISVQGLYQWTLARNAVVDAISETNELDMLHDVKEWLARQQSAV